MSTDERVSVRLGGQRGEHIGRIASFPPAGMAPHVTLDSGQTIGLGDIAAIAPATYTTARPRRKTADRRLGSARMRSGTAGTP